MSSRFFCHDLSASVVELTDAEAHHAIHVMRIAAGQQLELFDGRGTSATATVTHVRRRSADLQIQCRQKHPRSGSALLTVAASPPKGDRLKWMVEKLTEVGVDRFIPLISERTTAEPRSSKIEKLQATVISASKQCGRMWLMRIGEPLQLSDLLAQCSALAESVFFAHTEVSGNQHTMPDVRRKATTILIGPEGGFSPAEVSLAHRHGAHMINRLGPIMRTETAAVVLAALTADAQRALAEVSD